MHIFKFLIFHISHSFKSQILSAPFLCSFISKMSFLLLSIMSLLCLLQCPAVGERVEAGGGEAFAAGLQAFCCGVSCHPELLP